MTKLYRTTPTGIEYWETWEVKGGHIIHWGQLGDRGETETIPNSFFRSAAKKIALLINDKTQEGFQEIPDEDHHTLLIEYAVDGMGTLADVEKRHRLQTLMNETTGWTGLGNCDGGSIGSGTMEVCCFVVNFDIAAKVIAASLLDTEFADYTRIYREE